MAIAINTNHVALFISPIVLIFQNISSGRYDLQVLRKYLIPELHRQNEIKCVLKRQSTYLCIYTSELKFLDIVNYLGPGYSYASFLAAYGAGESKSYFCYEYLDTVEKLQSKEFPPYDAFYSKLKSCNVFEVDVPDSEDPSKTGLCRYEELKNKFYVNDWSLKDLLRHYNNADVKPFVVAIGNLLNYYKDRGQDIFKTAVSGEFFFLSFFRCRRFFFLFFSDKLSCVTLDESHGKI
jgi:hypothetical protein